MEMLSSAVLRYTAAAVALTPARGAATSGITSQGLTSRAAPDMVSFQFGDFHLDGPRRLLYRAGQPVPLVPKALELLELLIVERARTVSKRELLERLWPDTIVGDNNLSVTMSALRKALGESAAAPRHLQTLSRRGYRFVEDPGGERREAPELDVAPTSSSPARLRAAASDLSPESERLPPLVGRDAEHVRLQHRFARALGGSGQVVFVTGEPGIGKTALCESFVRSLPRYPLCVMRGRALEQFGRGEAYLPWIEAWGGLLAGPEGARASDVLRRVAPSWCREFPALFAGGDGAPRQVVEVSRDRLLREMGAALSMLAADLPLLVVLEDLHWADATTCDLLRWVCQQASRQRWLVIGTLRSVEAGLLNAPLASCLREAIAHGECEEIKLGPLSRLHVGLCVSAHFEQNDFPDELAELLYRKTEGHPLFLTRLLSFLAQRGDLVEREGVWSLGRPLEQLELEAPEDVRAMVRRKLDGLSPEQRSLLAYASVEGAELSSRVLAELCGLDVLELEERLQPLVEQHRLIDVIGEETWPDGELSTRYRFAHALYQNELYASLVARRRMQLHLRVAEILLRHSGAERGETERNRVAATLAVHFERGRDFPRAIEFLLAAGWNAHRLCAYAEEERHYVRGLELCEQLPEAERARPRLELLNLLGWALADAGQRARSERTFHELLELAEREGRHEYQCLAFHAMCSAAFFEGRDDETMRFAERHRQVAVMHRDRAEELLAIGCITGAEAGAGRFSEVLRLSLEYLPIMEREASRQTQAILWVNFGWACSYQARFEQADTAYSRALELWRGFSHVMAGLSMHELAWVRAQRGLTSEAFALFAATAELDRLHQNEFTLRRTPDGVGWLRRELGDLAGAEAHHRAGLDRARTHGAHFVEAWLLVESACDALALGDVARAERELALAEAGVSAGELRVFPCNVRRVQLRWRAARASCALAAGDTTRVRVEAGALLELARLDPSHQHQVIAHELCARALLAQGAKNEARQALAPALALLEEYPMPFVAWRVHALSAALHASAGEAEAAARERNRARALIEHIVSHVDDAELAARFRASPPVRAVLTDD